jgi:hypothetical protein
MVLVGWAIPINRQRMRLFMQSLAPDRVSRCASLADLEGRRLASEPIQLAQAGECRDWLAIANNRDLLLPRSSNVTLEAQLQPTA